MCFIPSKNVAQAYAWKVVLHFVVKYKCHNMESFGWLFLWIKSDENQFRDV